MSFYFVLKPVKVSIFNQFLWQIIASRYHATLGHVSNSWCEHHYNHYRQSKKEMYSKYLEKHNKHVRLLWDHKFGTFVTQLYVSLETFPTVLCGVWVWGSIPSSQFLFTALYHFNMNLSTERTLIQSNIRPATGSWRREDFYMQMARIGRAIM